MNIKHVEIPEDFKFPEDLLGDIFAKQAKLAKKYAAIEGHPEWPCENINSKETQAHIKDFAWRTVEELCEMRVAEDTSVDKDHGYEELGDALHFLTEMCLIFDYDYHGLCPNRQKPMEAIFEQAKNIFLYSEFNLELSIEDFIVKLGWGMNHLKCKKWKQTLVPTDMPQFIKQIDQVWISFALICRVRDIGPKDLYLLYYKKELVNNWRIKTQY